MDFTCVQFESLRDTLSTALRMTYDRMISELVCAGVEVKFVDADHISQLDDTDRYDGYFCDGGHSSEFELPTLITGVKKPATTWFQVFLHEYCHFRQWSEHASVWSDAILPDGKHMSDVIFECFSKRCQLSCDDIDRYCALSAACELDCERRVVDIIVSDHLPIDVDNYIKCANAMIAFYFAMPTLHAWCNRVVPGDIKAIYSAMPATFDRVDHRALANEHFKHFRRCVL